MPNPLSEIIGAIAPFDPADLTAIAGGLQLLPENAERIVRLEALAHAAASIAPATSTKTISSPRLRALLNNVLYRLFGAAEDPPPDCIVEEIPFYGGSYRVFPGAGESFSFIIRNLIAAIFLSPHITDKQFLQDAYEATAAILCLSDEIALRAGLRRGTEPTATSRDVTVPSSDALQRLKGCVTFTEAELQTLLSRRNAGINAITQFVAEAGADHASSYTVEVGPLRAQPIVRFTTRYIVASPGALLDALAHRLNCLAIQRNLQADYAVAYNHAIRASTAESFRYLRHEILSPAPTKLAVPPTVTECLAALDNDKVTHALVVTDTLDGYDLTGKNRHWDMEQLSTFLVERMKEVEQQLHVDGLNRRILFLLVHQATGRAYGLGLPKFSDTSLFHMVSAADLRTISLVDAGDPLAIWSFVEAADRLRDKQVLVQVWNTLDEYGFFRRHEYSFYVGDDRPPNVIAIHPADFARPLRCTVARRLDVQAVRHFGGKGTVEVRSLHSNSEIPIYVPVGPRRGRIAVYMDALDRPVWILGPEKTENDAIYEELADAIAFWLWQAKDALHGILPDDSLLIIEVSIADELSPESQTVKSLPAVLIEQSSSSSIKIVFTSTFRDLVRQADNRADRELLKSLRLALTPNAGAGREEQTNALVNGIAPLGLKKKLLSFNPGADPALDGQGLPPYRGVRKYQIGKLLDAVGEHLSAEKFAVGPIADAERTTVLNRIVSFCYGKLRDLVASLAEEDTLDFVISQHEAILHRQAVGKATIATRLACFGNDPNIVASFQKALQDEARDAISIRFLIEYLATVPPGGQLPITLERFDEMLMLASEITNFGMLSDTVQNDLADLKLSVVPSGRLGISDDQYKRASRQYMEAFAGHEMYVAPQVFRRLTVTPEEDAEPPQLVEDLDAAAVAEFGYSMADLSRFMSELLRFNAREKPFCIAKFDEIHKSVGDATGWSDQQITSIMESLILRPRADFLKPEAPFAAVEVYPWRFNRSLSYLRRPLIERKRDNGDEIIWGYRNVYHAHDNLLKLCLSGRLRATSTEMKNFISAVTNRQGSHFNDQVAQLFVYPELQVRKRVNKIPGATGLNNVGDLDVLVADTGRKRLDVVECKDLSNARTPHERRLEIENLLGSERVQNPIVARHDKRVKWVKENLQSVLKWLGVADHKGWKIDACIVVDHPLMAPYLRQMPIRVVPFAELESELINKYAKVARRTPAAR
jgi:hypothetical protein